MFGFVELDGFVLSRSSGWWRDRDGGSVDGKKRKEQSTLWLNHSRMVGDRTRQDQAQIRLMFLVCFVLEEGIQSLNLL